MNTTRGLALDGIKDVTKLKKDDIQEWFKKVDRLKILATNFNDQSALEELNKHIQRMDWAFKALTGKNSPTVNKGQSYSPHSVSRSQSLT